MSTDYGYGCRSCNTSHIIDNCREPAILQAWFDEFT